MDIMILMDIKSKSWVMSRVKLSDSIMTRRGGRGKQGGHRREDGANRIDSVLLRSSHETNPIPPISGVNVEESQEPEQQQSPQLCDTVYEAEQEVDNGLTRKKRGITCGKGARKIMKASKKRLLVEFNFEMRRVISENESSFMHECGYILRKNCSLQYKEWRHVPSEDKLSLRHKLTTLFEFDVEDPNVCKVIDSYMARAWRGYRAELHVYFKEIQGLADLAKAKATPPPGTRKEDWEYLCDMWSETKYLENAEKKVMARGKRKVDSRNGSKSTIRYHLERGQDLDALSGQIETWRLTHWDAEQGWISTEAVALYEDMMKLRNKHSVESMSDKMILEKVLGRSSVRLRGWGRDPNITSNTMGTSQNTKRPTYDEVVDQVETLKAKCAAMEQTLIERNIMPPPTSTSGPSQDDTSERGEDMNQ
ncbi:hypothetical protein SSX86_014066 [Deinandra increscens subsp. villosa]|uniref:Transposase, Ptta/En/Spm, plant n=1 Tax=Deinandra increscens subsp. villosa TaxID=3103831 RepID=A0AAP0D8V1_9ASTR